MTYESSVRLQHRRASHVVSSVLRNRPHGPNLLQALRGSHVFPDVESSSFTIARSLLPIMRQLKWCIRRDDLAKMVRDSKQSSRDEGGSNSASAARWIESRSTLLVGESERVRLAICPGVKKIVEFYEHLARTL